MIRRRDENRTCEAAIDTDPADREKLTLLARRPKTAQRVAIRTKIVLHAAEGLSNQQIAEKAEKVGLSQTAMVHIWH